MKVGISTASFHLKRETEDALKTIKDLGAPTAEVFLSTFYEYRPEFAKLCLPAAEGLEIYSVHALAPDFEPHLFSPSRRVRGDGYYWLDQIMRTAQRLGAQSYTFHGVLGHSAMDVGGAEGAIAAAVEFCARYNIKLCLENVFWSTYCRPWIFSRIKRSVPSLSGAFDIKQARRSGYPWQAYLKDMRGSISHVHLSDFDENGVQKLPGFGKFDFRELLLRLKDAEFDGRLFIEVYSNAYSDEADLKRSMDYLNEQIDKLD